MKNAFHKPWFAVLLIVLFGAIAYHNCLPNEMFWDDDDFIHNNRYIRDFHDWPLWFSQNMVAGSYLVSNYWRPLLLAVFALEWHWWHNWVYGWHAVSVGMHILAAVMLYFLLARLFADRLLACLVALIFVTHPVHNEAVVYVNSMGDCQAAFLVFAGLLLYARFRQSGKPAWASRSYFGSLLFFILGVLSKETAFVLVGLIPLADLLLLSKAKSFWMRTGRTLKTVWPLLLLGVTYIVLRATVLNFANSFNFYNEKNAFTSHISIRLMTFFKAMAQYAGFLFFPHQLRVERYLPWAQSPFEWDVMAGGGLVGLMIYCIFKYWRTKPWLSFGFAWFFTAIAPTSNVLVPINAVIYEHFLYMPMVGVALVAAYAALDWARAKGAVSTLLKIIAVILVVFCGVNIHRNLDWRTSIGFYEQLVTYRPDDYRVINNLGMEYANNHINDKALKTYLKAIALDPKNPVAYHNIAGLYRDTGHIDLALQNFHKALELNPNFIFSYRSLAALYLQRGDYENARENLLQLLRMDPTDQNARQVLQMVDQKLQGISSAK